MAWANKEHKTFNLCAVLNICIHKQCKFYFTSLESEIEIQFTKIYNTVPESRLKHLEQNRFTGVFWKGPGCFTIISINLYDPNFLHSHK